MLSVLRIAIYFSVPRELPAGIKTLRTVAGPVETVIAVGGAFAGSMASVMLTLVVVGVMWPAVFVSTGTRLGMFFASIVPVAVMRLPIQMMLVSIISVFVTLASGFFPFWLAQLILVFLVTWLYVGAREVFGGLSENGRKKTAPKLAPAGAPSA